MTGGRRIQKKPISQPYSIYSGSCYLGLFSFVFLKEYLLADIK